MIIILLSSINDWNLFWNITAQDRKEENKYLKEEVALGERITQKTVKIKWNMLILFFMNSHTKLYQ